MLSTALGIRRKPRRPLRWRRHQAEARNARTAPPRLRRSRRRNTTRSWVRVRARECASWRPAVEDGKKEITIRLTGKEVIILVGRGKTRVSLTLSNLPSEQRPKDSCSCVLLVCLFPWKRNITYRHLETSSLFPTRIHSILGKKSNYRWDCIVASASRFGSIASFSYLAYTVARSSFVTIPSSLTSSWTDYT